MTERASFLAELPVRAVLDGELVAFVADGKPDFELVRERMLHRHSPAEAVPTTPAVARNAWTRRAGLEGAGGVYSPSPPPENQLFEFSGATAVHRRP